MRLLAGVVFLVLWVHVAVSDVAQSDEVTFDSQTAVGTAIQQGCSTCGCMTCGCPGFSGTSVLIASRLGLAAWPGSVSGGWSSVTGQSFPLASHWNSDWWLGIGSGAVHYRYPYYSYRRPWAHPGPMVPNVTIVW
jgi:hypothetical protein